MPLLRFIPETTNVNFVKYRFAAFAVDGLLLVIAVVSIMWYGFNLGIDFTGGVLMEVKSRQTIDISQMRADVDSLGFRESHLQYFGGGECERPVNSCVMIRIQPKSLAQGGDQEKADQAVVQAVRGKLGPSYEYRRTEVVGPKVSGELLDDGIMATILAVAMISIYVAFRFEWQYGVGALIATGHDVFVTAGFYSIMGLDFNINTVAALLLLAGYSINDTVVVFDRIRENLRKYKRMPMGELIDLSINETFSRTMITGPTALMALAGLAIFGGEALWSFSMVLMFGLVFGTYSSIYVGAPLLMFWKRKEEPEGVVAAERP